MCHEVAPSEQFLGKLDILEIGDEEKIKNSEFYKKKNP